MDLSRDGLSAEKVDFGVGEYGRAILPSDLSITVIRRPILKLVRVQRHLAIAP